MAVEFNEPASVLPTRTKRPSLLSRLVLKTGVVKTEQGAQVIFLIVILLSLAGAFFFFNYESEGPPAPSFDQI